MTTLETYSTLWSYARRQYGDRSGTKADTEVQQACDDAVWMVAKAKRWPWLNTMGRLNLVASYNTGTVAITVATTGMVLSGGTWPTWAASGEVLVNGIWQKVTTRTSGTDLVMTNAWGEATITAENYLIAQHSYTLPDDLMMIESIMLGKNWHANPEPVSPAVFEVMRDRYTAGQAAPLVFTIAKDQFKVWPPPTTARMINITYFRRPNPSAASGATTVDFDPLHLDLIFRAIDYQISLRGECVAGSRQECQAGYQDALADASPYERTSENRTIGGYGNADDAWVYSQFFNTITP
jgi:hypothetical protein